MFHVVVRLGGSYMGGVGHVGWGVGGVVGSCRGGVDLVGVGHIEVGRSCRVGNVGGWGRSYRGGVEWDYTRPELNSEDLCNCIHFISSF